MKERSSRREMDWSVGNEGGKKPPVTEKGSGGRTDGDGIWGGGEVVCMRL